MPRTPANPFITHGYVSPYYFCDREEETAYLTTLLAGGNNVALISPRRLGKTGLISHCFHLPGIRETHYTFLVDIYATKNLQELVYALGKAVLETLKSRGRRAWEFFVNTVGSLRSSISFDINGNPEWGVGVGDIKVPQTTLDEIFAYLERADRPCLVAIDEFQAIAHYPEKNAEAMLRTRIQHCRNTLFIFAGSQRHVMTEMFVSPARPFYQSTMLMTLAPIAEEHYTDFARRLFQAGGKDIAPEAIRAVYHRYDGITWYLQSVLNVLYQFTATGTTCTADDIDAAIDTILQQQSFAYTALLYQLPARQKEVLAAICRERQAANITAQPFLERHHLTASTVQAAVKGLLDKDFITHDEGRYSVCDRFFAQWLARQ